LEWVFGVEGKGKRIKEIKEVNKGQSINIKRILKAIPGTGGIITSIQAKTGYGWFTIKNAIDTNPNLLEAYNTEKEKILDMAESGIITSIKGGDQQDRKWYLAMQGRKRGYGDKIDFGDEPLKIKIVYDEKAEPNDAD
jgi:hypothetical protein